MTWTPDKSSRDGCSLPGVFCCSRKGQAILREGSGGRHRQAPGKPERNAVPRKGDTMGMARAGNWLPIPTARHHIFSVHTAASRGTAEFFYSTHFYLFPNKNTKRHLVFITGVPDTLPVRFFCVLKRRHQPPYRSRAPPSSLENCLTKFQDWRESE